MNNPKRWLIALKTALLLLLGYLFFLLVFGFGFRVLVLSFDEPIYKVIEKVSFQIMALVFMGCILYLHVLVVRYGLYVFLKKNYLAFVQGGVEVDLNEKIAIAYAWGYVWRASVTQLIFSGVIYQLLFKYGPFGEVGLVESLLGVVEVYLAFYWLLLRQYGNTKIDRLVVVC